MSDSVVACWSCGGPNERGVAFCTTCKAVQPPGQLDHFTRLGLPQQFALDPQELNRVYFTHQRLLHPDRFARRSARERAVAQLQAAAINEAYETLRQPLQRAAYLAALQGVALPADGSTISDPELLIEAMEARESLMEAGDVATVDRLAQLAAQQLQAGIEALEGLFLQADGRAIRKALLRLRYLEKFSDEARARRLNLGTAVR